MKLKPKHSIAEHFDDIEDIRIERGKKHKLIDIITISICAVVCGADGWIDIEMYGIARKKWLEKFLELPNGIPSHDTFARVFSQINPDEFNKSFLSWIKGISKITAGEIIAFDGKQSRNSGDEKNGQGVINTVSAWAASNRLVLGQKKVEGKSNEITALPELIQILDLAGCIVTIDAMGCQREIVKKIVEKDADYVIAVKKNQPTLYKQVKQLFKQAIETQGKDLNLSSFNSREMNRGREEIRNYLMITDVAEQIDPLQKWKKLTSIGMVESVRVVGGKTSVETRYFISSLESDAQKLAEGIRSHWSIENSLHWVLDVAFKEDDSRIRKDNAPANFAILRHIAVNIISENKSRKLSVRSKRFLATLDEEYSTELLEAIL
ncbi:ISAs1 family transposase [Chamaesiphon minutus]|uniref:Transposase n=1 Tax=Chamaesiphon minutus (strain ATCC 27169 / PCC 6605) TaxID=1173020 RepID=K9UAA2_CHAP6|nr:ISAs1 family transposase [Chamaesiphon minutus]AFY91553.1 transposase [Chamaesiphon minutus PCC 6605]AFY92170.1 transposase [Chamaesiphon minutus PCC 6605]AFY92226.1 transposase [Chamaesiphon minutus PCC 6605]AFY92377.1 transposase [Chamaesiphon minutus PCC 6605]AFY94793.1 transposase [Chamaesiphon minutus PCC 6605]